MKKLEKVVVEHRLILRTCNADMTSRNEFVWPKSGIVSAPDWKPTEECGNGLHGFLDGEGDGDLASWEPDAVWVAAWIDPNLAIHLGGKVKFPWANVAFAGSREDAIAYLRTHGCTGPIIGGTATAGYRGTATAGYRGTATAGDGGTATAGDGGTATAGYRGTATAGDGGTATAGDGGTATAGYRGTATAGDGGTATAGYGGTATAGYRGTATAGDGGTATAGDGGTATAGYRGTATAGDGGTATAGYGGTATAGYRGTATAGDGGTATAGDGGTATAGGGGTATAGDGGVISFLYWNGEKYKRSVFAVGENDVKPNTAYRCRGDGTLVEVSK